MKHELRTTRSTLPQMEDETIVSEILGGQPALFELLMRRHNQKLYRVARGMNVPDVECDDLIQQTYIQAYQKLDQFKGTAQFSTWLIRILINQRLMAVRKSKTVISEQGVLYGLDRDDENRAAATVLDPATPESEMIKKEMRMVLERAIEQLSEEYRAVYVMREIEDMSIRDIAECLGITESNVKVRLHRARKLLHTTLRHHLMPHEIFSFGSKRCDRVVTLVMECL